ncbi:MAG: hypothetical protein J0M35_18910 [Candidatus Obscuribacter phosphatis]|uniref:Uncharacterized protein n=1 Tax=Candidatus Obscuribacter phosphatis TaxID=1906157 RepID=A0A8J7PL09_9BACT|nr:hypothetical protein [Candidatus Obscuribacter phosphatis]
MAGRTRRSARRKKILLTAGLTCFLATGISAGIFPRQTGASAKSLTRQQKQVIAKELHLAGLAARKANLKMDQDIEALAEALPVLLSRLTKKLAPGQVITSPVLETTEPVKTILSRNPYAQEKELAGELSRQRAEYAAAAPAVQHQGFGSTKIKGDRREQEEEQTPRLYIVGVSPQEISETTNGGELSETLKAQTQTNRIAGTYYVFCDRKQFLVTAIGLEGEALHGEKGLRASLGAIPSTGP